MKKATVLYIIYLAGIVMAMLAIIEFASFKLFEHGVDFAAIKKQPNREGGRTERFGVIDPHLGYARSDNSTEVKNLLKRGHGWYKGFAIYGNYLPGTKPNFPVILIVGGSTADPVRKEYSWPEALYTLSKKNGKNIIVVNGATGGYTSSQELLKLIRDGLEFKPDIIISYGGLRDLPSVSPLPHPMIPNEQRKTLISITTRSQSSILPNTVKLLKGISGTTDGVTEYTLGVPTNLSAAEWWLRNIGLMQAISNYSGAGFCAILQPMRPDASKTESERFLERWELRKAQIGLSKQTNYVFDFTKALDTVDNGFDDDVHATRAGDRVVAEKVYDLLFNKSQCLSGAVAIN